MISPKIRRELDEVRSIRTATSSHESASCWFSASTASEPPYHQTCRAVVVVVVVFVAAAVDDDGSGRVGRIGGVTANTSLLPEFMVPTRGPLELVVVVGLPVRKPSDDQQFKLSIIIAIATARCAHLQDESIVL